MAAITLPVRPAVLESVFRGCTFAARARVAVGRCHTDSLFSAISAVLSCFGCLVVCVVLACADECRLFATSQLAKWPGHEVRHDVKRQREKRIWLVLTASLLGQCVQVYPNVFVGDLTCALDLKQLAERNITHIITATNKMKPMHGKTLHYLVLDFPDSADQNILDTFVEAHKFMDDAIACGGKGQTCICIRNFLAQLIIASSPVVLVHCMMGQSRSVTVVTSFMMRQEGISEEEVRTRVDSCVCVCACVCVCV